MAHYFNEKSHSGKKGVILLKKGNYVGNKLLHNENICLGMGLHKIVRNLQQEKYICYKVNQSTESVLEACNHMFSSKFKMLGTIFLDSANLRSFTLEIFG